MVVEIFEVVVDGCRWLLVVVGGFRWFQVVSGGFRLVLTLFKGLKEKFLKKIGRSITARHSSGHSLLRSFS